MPTRDPVDTDTLDDRRLQIELETFAHDPARKPRTECGCQPVAFVSDAMVAPPGERNMSIAVDCFVPDRTAVGAPFSPAFSAFSRLLNDTADLFVVGFFAAFGIGISFGSAQPNRLHRRSPAKAYKPAGRDPGAPRALPKQAQ